MVNARIGGKSRHFFYLSMEATYGLAARRRGAKLLPD